MAQPVNYIINPENMKICYASSNLERTIRYGIRRLIQNPEQPLEFWKKNQPFFLIYWKKGIINSVVLKKTETSLNPDGQKIMSAYQTSLYRKKKKKTSPSHKLSDRELYNLMG